MRQHRARHSSDLSESDFIAAAWRVHLWQLGIKDVTDLQQESRKYADTPRKLLFLRLRAGGSLGKIRFHIRNKVPATHVRPQYFGYR